jgi:predicted aspartyl protease
MKTLALLAAIAAGSACVQIGGAPGPAEVTGAGEIPFTLAGGGGAAVLVPVYINGAGPYRFVLDTGATLTCVDEELAERLQLPKPVGMLGYGASVGETGTVGLHTIDTIKVGSASATRLTACALDLQRMEKVGLTVDGLLGLNFLKSFKVTLDFERKVLSLAARP